MVGYYTRSGQGWDLPQHSLMGVSEVLSIYRQLIEIRGGRNIFLSGVAQVGCHIPANNPLTMLL